MYKRLFDVVIASLLLLILAPVLLIVAFLIKIFDRGDVFFIQSRPGLNETPFNLIKFKTMRTLSEGELVKGSDAHRITTVGYFLRKYSLDELPELFNVLKGEMSLVGPRPLLFRYIPFMTDAERRRHSVKPGITGLAQIRGRNTVDWSKRFSLDLLYIKNRSLKYDLYILFGTLKVVLYSVGAYPDANSVMKDLDDDRK